MATNYRLIHRDGYAGPSFASMTAAELWRAMGPGISEDWRIELERAAGPEPGSESEAELIQWYAEHDAGGESTGD